MRRAQMTLYVALGLVLLVVTGFFVFVIAIQRSAVSSANSQASKTGFLTSEALRVYVDQCLAQTTTDAVLALGKEGGLLLNFSIGEKRLRYFDQSVVYGILEPRYSTDFPPYPVPTYPYAGRLVSSNFPYYGQDGLMALCALHGTGALGRTETLVRPCTSYHETQSIEHQLQMFVMSELPRCLKFTDIEGLPHSLDVGDPMANVTIGAVALRFDVYYPMNLSIEGKRSEHLERFTYTLPVRLKILHEFAKNVIQQETTNHLFTLGQAIMLPTYQNGFSVEKVMNACPGCEGQGYDDLFIVRDARSVIRGKPYTLQFAVEDRIPALDLIHDTPPTFSQDIIVQSGDKILIAPIGYDPDDEQVTYRYTGWKASELMQSSEYALTGQNASIVPTRGDEGSWNVTVIVQDEQGNEDYQVVRVQVRDVPFYRIEGQTLYGDIVNPHVISIEDPHTLRLKLSCQTCDILSLIWKFTHPLDQVPYHTIETDRIDIQLVPEPNILTIRSQPISAIGDGISLQIKARSSNIEEHYNDARIFACLPHRSLQSVFPYSSTGATTADAFLGDHACCVGDPSRVDAVLAGSAADQDWGTYKPRSAVCRDEHAYICSPQLKAFSPARAILYQADATGTLTPYPAAVFSGPVASAAQNGSTLNDIYRRKLKQNCSGTRGNVCAGDVEYTIEHVRACGEANTEVGEDERCSGPRKTHSSCFSEGTDESCVNYRPGQTFERNFMLGTVNGGVELLDEIRYNGICNDNMKRSSAIDSATYDSGTGRYNCKGQCDGAGGCGWTTGCVCGPASYGGDVECEGKTPNTCSGPQTGFCTNQCVLVSPSASAQSCQACGGQYLTQWCSAGYEIVGSGYICKFDETFQRDQRCTPESSFSFGTIPACRKLKPQFPECSFP